MKVADVIPELDWKKVLKARIEELSHYPRAVETRGRRIVHRRIPRGRGIPQALGRPRLSCTVGLRDEGIQGTRTGLKRSEVLDALLVDDVLEVSRHVALPVLVGFVH